MFYLLYFFSPDKFQKSFHIQVYLETVVVFWQKYARNFVLMMVFLGQTRTGQKNTSGLAVLSGRLLKKPSLHWNSISCVFLQLPHEDGKYCQILERILVVFLHSLNRPDCKAKFSLATNFAFPALRAWYMCKTLHKVISPYGPHDKICNSKWLKKLFFMEVWFFSDFIILWQQKNAANLLSHIVYLFDCKDWKDKYFFW